MCSVLFQIFDHNGKYWKFGHLNYCKQDFKGKIFWKMITKYEQLSHIAGWALGFLLLQEFFKKKKILKSMTKGDFWNFSGVSVTFFIVYLFFFLCNYVRVFQLRMIFTDFLHMFTFLKLENQLAKKIFGKSYFFPKISNFAVSVYP